MTAASTVYIRMHTQTETLFRCGPAGRTEDLDHRTEARSESCAATPRAARAGRPSAARVHSSGAQGGGPTERRIRITRYGRWAPPARPSACEGRHPAGVRFCFNVHDSLVTRARSLRYRVTSFPVRVEFCTTRRRRHATPRGERPAGPEAWRTAVRRRAAHGTLMGNILRTRRCHLRRLRPAQHTVIRGCVPNGVETDHRGSTAQTRARPTPPRHGAFSALLGITLCQCMPQPTSLGRRHEQSDHAMQMAAPWTAPLSRA